MIENSYAPPSLHVNPRDLGCAEILDTAPSLFLPPARGSLVFVGGGGAPAANETRAVSLIEQDVVTAPHSPDGQAAAA